MATRSAEKCRFFTLNRWRDGMSRLRLRKLRAAWRTTPLATRLQGKDWQVAIGAVTSRVPGANQII